MNNQPTIEPNAALANVIAVYKQARLTPEEHEIVKASINVLLGLVEREQNRAKEANAN